MDSNAAIKQAAQEKINEFRDSVMQFKYDERLTFEGLAGYTGVEKNTLGSFARGKGVNATTLVRLSLALGISIS